MLPETMGQHRCDTLLDRDQGIHVGHRTAQPRNRVGVGAVRGIVTSPDKPDADQPCGQIFLGAQSISTQNHDAKQLSIDLSYFLDF